MTPVKRELARDELTEVMETCVAGWFWYGFHSVAEIYALIEQEAALGDGFDNDQVKVFAASMLVEKRAAEAQWPPTTDCDKLDRVFARLREQRICALQYGGDTMDDGFEAVNDAVKANRASANRYAGFCFFHSQDMDHALQGDGLMLAFGSLDSGDPQNMVAVGQTVCEALQDEGLEVKWSGTHKRRIELPRLRWQRRTPG